LGAKLILARDHPILTFGTLGPFESLEFEPMVESDVIPTVTTRAVHLPPADASQTLWDYAVRHRTGFDQSPPAAPVLAPVLLSVGAYNDATLELIWMRFDESRVAEWKAIQKVTDHPQKMSPWFLRVLRYSHPLEMDAPRWAKAEEEKDRAIITKTLSHISRHLNIVCMQDDQWVY